MTKTNEYWYAVLTDREDTDWGTGSFDKDEAIQMAAEMDCEMIAVIRGDYVDGEPTADPICAAELIKGEDF